MCEAAEGDLHRKHYRTSRDIVLNHVINWLRMSQHVSYLFPSFTSVARML